MTKLVNIFPNGPITTINPPIRIRLSKVSMNIADIRKCLIAKAYVEEVLDGNKTIQLTFENYDKNNDGPQDVKEEPKMVPVNHDVKDATLYTNVEEDNKTLDAEPKKDSDVNNNADLEDKDKNLNNEEISINVDDVTTDVEESNTDNTEYSVDDGNIEVSVTDVLQETDNTDQKDDDSEESNIDDTETDAEEVNGEQTPEDPQTSDNNNKEVVSNKSNNKKNKKGKVTYQKLN